MDIQQRTLYKGAIGFDDVKRLIESGNYVDKSLFVRDILKDPSGVLLITRPRRWGKSSNMSLLKTFLEIEVDEQGNPLPDAKKVNPVYFTGGVLGEGKKQISHEGLKIYQESDTMEELGQYPVIMINFKDLGGSTYSELVEGFKIKLRRAFDQHKYLLASSNLDPTEKAQLSDYLSKNITEAEVK